jgi:tRNA(Arg) A34 adenosine deaminase TadA/CheY-like chemotaxis protein
MPHSKGHILIVEPNDITRKLIVGILNSHGYETWEAEGGDEAQVYLGKFPSLVILDVDDENPGIMGFLRKIQMSHSRLPLVAMSDQEDTEALRTRLALRTMSVLRKPVVPGSLIASINDHLVKGIDAEVAARTVETLAESATDPAVQKQRAAFMARALDIAQEKMDVPRGLPFGAVVVRGGKIIGEGWNASLSDKDPTAHAEIMALRAAAKAVGSPTLEGCEVYASCEPCPMCLAALYWAKVDRVFYASTREDADGAGFDDAYIHGEIVQPEHKRALPSKMFLHDEGRIVLDTWTKKGER